MLHKDLCNVGPYGWQTMYVRKITIQCWIDPSETASHKKTTHTVLAQSAQTCFCRKTGCSFKWLVVCFLTGYNILNNLGSFCSMFAREFIYGFWDNNGQELTLTGTSSQATFWKKTFSGNVKESTVFSVNTIQNTPRPKWEIQKFGNCWVSQI